MTPRRCVPRCARLQRGVEPAHRLRLRYGDLRVMREIGPRCELSASRWRNWRRSPPAEVVRGEIFRLSAPRGTRGREQRGARYAVVVQADELLSLSTVLVSPTSRSAQPASFRPVITLDGTPTRILVEQSTVVDPERLGRSAGRLDPDRLNAVDEALALVLGL